MNGKNGEIKGGKEEGRETISSVEANVVACVSVLIVM